MNIQTTPEPDSKSPGPKPRAPFRIAMIGFGNVGTGLVHHIREHATLLNERIEGGMEFVGIAVRSLDTPRSVDPPSNTLLTDNWRELVDDPSIDAIVEVVGVGSDGKPTIAFEMARAVLTSGKHFVTANKALIAEHGGELQELAEEAGVLLLFEASVGAGIPVITSLQGGLAANKVNSVHGILNGTCNYILTRMEEDPALLLADAVKEAQDLGYAEPDPRFDIEGDDAAYKIAILGSLAFGQELHISDAEKEGITRLSPAELTYARDNDLALRLIASAVCHPGDRLEVSVRPAFLPSRHVLAGVRGVNNAVLVDAEPIGETLYYGAGAGQGSTASGLLADVITAARHWNPDAGNPHPLRIVRGRKTLVGTGAVRGRHYLRIGDDSIPEPEFACEIIPNEDSGITLITEEITLERLHSFLGMLRQSGIPDEAICHVSFAFE